MKEESRGVNTLLESYPPPSSFLIPYWNSVTNDIIHLNNVSPSPSLSCPDERCTTDTKWWHWVGIWARKNLNVSLLLFKSRAFLTEQWGFTQSLCGLGSFLAGPWLAQETASGEIGAVGSWLMGEALSRIPHERQTFSDQDKSKWWLLEGVITIFSLRAQLVDNS